MVCELWGLGATIDAQTDNEGTKNKHVTNERRMKELTNELTKELTK
jgi:hypothetical protein